MFNDVVLQSLSSQISQADSQENSIIKYYELELNQVQFKALQKLLPKGYSLEVLTKGKREAAPRPQKKVVTNEGNVVKRNSSTIEMPTLLPPPEINSSTRKVSLREKKKVRSHLETKYPDFEAIPTTSSKVYKANNEGARKCLNLLLKLKKHPCAGPFLQPVDVEGLGLLDYYDIVTEPMDVSTVEQRLKDNYYNSVVAFAMDIRKIWTNAFRYNPKGTYIYQMTSEMSDHFEKLFKEIENVSFNDTIRDLEKKVERLSKQITEYHHRGGRVGQTSKSSKSSSMLDRPMTSQEKKLLGQNIRSLPPEYLRGVWDIICTGLPSIQNKEEIEFDIETLPARVSRELERFVKNKIALLAKANQNKKKGKETASSKQSFGQVGTDMASYDPSGKPSQGVDFTEDYNQQPSVSGNGFEKAPTAQVKPEGDEDDKSSESSFISDSDDGSDDEDRPKQRQPV
jgi:hypothetical protein